MPVHQILEQVEGGELVVNKGKDDVPKTGGNGKERDLNAIEGFEAGFKLAEVSPVPDTTRTCEWR